MCGIVGYLGNEQAYPVLIKGLKRLEYRGYDSAGVAMINDNGDLNVYKTKGKVADLEHYCEDKNVSGTIGIAHTRWATHGAPSSVNAHPHYSQSRNLAIIHNGIIENYAELKKQLIEKGMTFKSDTDTEVLVQLIEYIQVKKNLDTLTAVQLALHQVIGAQHQLLRLAGLGFGGTSALACRSVSDDDGRVGRGLGDLGHVFVFVAADKLQHLSLFSLLARRLAM